MGKSSWRRADLTVRANLPSLALETAAAHPEGVVGIISIAEHRAQRRVYAARSSARLSERRRCSRPVSAACRSTEILDLQGSRKIGVLPEHLVVAGSLNASGSDLSALPDRLYVLGDVRLDGCKGLSLVPHEALYRGA